MSPVPTRRGIMLNSVYMQTRMKSLESQDWTVLLESCPRPQFEAGCTGSSSSLLESERQERLANSKLERLADELRALGIEF